jgi:hypothetical protein
MFRTVDLSIAAFLASRGLKFIECQRINDRQAEFVFDDSQAIGAKLVADYYGDGQCTARIFHKQLRIMRSLAEQAVRRG